jgi:hypothetical protein
MAYAKKGPRSAFNSYGSRLTKFMNMPMIQSNKINIRAFNEKKKTVNVVVMSVAIDDQMCEIGGYIIDRTRHFMEFNGKFTLDQFRGALEKSGIDPDYQSEKNIYAAISAICALSIPITWVNVQGTYVLDRIASFDDSSKLIDAMWQAHVPGDKCECIHCLANSKKKMHDAHKCNVL